MTTQSRQPKGTPVGGQFAGKANPECNIDIVDHHQEDLATPTPPEGYRYHPRGLGLVHKTASVDESAWISGHTAISPGVTVGAGAYIGSNVTVESGAVIERGAYVDDNCHIAADVYLAPGVVVWSDSTIGSNATVGPYAKIFRRVSIGERAVVAPGTTVADDERIEAGRYSGELDFAQKIRSGEIKHKLDLY
ncbi:MAG: LbetaH domain-containing protein [Acidimicrobiales bacterium]